MASVIGCVLGGTPKRVEGVETVADVKRKMELGTGKFAVTVNGESADETDEVSDDQLVSFAPAVKGGAQHQS